jgi:hypothetical protein
VWNHATARKKAKGIGPEWTIYNLIKYSFTIRKSSFIFIKKCETTFRTTQ